MIGGRAIGLLMIAAGLAFVLPGLAFLVLSNASYTVGTSFSLIWLVVAAAAGAALVAGGVWAGRSRPPPIMGTGPKPISRDEDL